MTTLLVAKQIIMTIYSKYEVYITPLLKFLLALIALLLINSRLGYMESIDKSTVVLIVALMCSFMPINFIVVMAAAFTMLHLYSFSLECAAVVGAGFLLMFLLYLRFSPKDTLVVVFMPICFLLKVPYIVPLAMGLIGTPASAVSVACGVIAYYMIHYVTQNVSAIAAMAGEETAAKFRFIIDGLLNNKEMVVTMIAGNVVAFLLALVLQFFVFNVDYSRTEKVQFEDDEYYYYVKAVPKVTVARPEKKVKQINSQKSKAIQKTKSTH